MKLHLKQPRLLVAALLAVIATWAPWIVYVAMEPDEFDVALVLILLLAPALGLLVPASQMAYENGPEWIQPIIDIVIVGTLDADWEWLAFVWLLPLAGLLWAMTTLGARGNWSQALVFLIGLAFQIVSAVFFHNSY